VNYIDGKGNESTRLMLCSGEKKWWFPKGTDQAMQIPADWLCAAVDEVIKSPTALLSDALPDGRTGLQVAADIPANQVDVMAEDTSG